MSSMAKIEKENAQRRQYPAFYEKFIPITIGIISIIIVAVLVFALGVAIGLI